MNQRKIKQSFHIALLITAGLMPFQLNYANKKDAPYFQNNSYFDYDIYWNFLKVGFARLNFHELEASSNDSERYEINISIKSNNLINAIYPVDNYIVSTLLKTDENTKPLIYKKRSNEGGKQRNTVVKFDYQLNQIIEEKNNIQLQPIALTPNLKDPLSLILALCQNDFQTNPIFKQDVSDGGQIISIKSSYLNKEVINTSLGEFQTHAINVETKGIRGVFKKNPNAEVVLFLSEHSPSIPVKFMSKIRVGNFHALLSGGMHNGIRIKGMKKEPLEVHSSSKKQLGKRFKR
jgi:hypothetical protein